MTGVAERVLYVGQSGNLRQRLATYKNCNLNQLPRRIVRLIHQVERISWEVCPTALQARLRENQLLRLHRPKFNRVNVYPRSYGFIGLKCDGDHLTLWLTRDGYPQENLFGAFKGGYIQAYAALVRLLWAALHKPTTLEGFPCGLLAERPPRSHAFALAKQQRPEFLHERLTSFFSGESLELVEWFSEQLPRTDALSAFQRNLHESDLQCLTDFFSVGPRRNRRVREIYLLNDGIVPQEKLDDFILATT